MKPIERTSKYVGRRYGKLCVMSVRRVGLHQYFALAKCDCGIEKEIRVTALADGRVKSCGCSWRNHRAQTFAAKALSPLAQRQLIGPQEKCPVVEHNSKYVGRRYGKLIVLSVRRKPGARIYFADVRCDCGILKAINTNHLADGRVQSCGCMHRAWVPTHDLLGTRFTTKKLAENIGISASTVSEAIRSGMTAEEIFDKYNHDGLVKLRLSRSKKRGRPLKTLEGREISHEELLRGLVEHSATLEATVNHQPSEAEGTRSVKRRTSGWAKRYLAMIRAETREAKRLPKVPAKAPEGCVGVQTWGPLPAKPPGAKR